MNNDQRYVVMHKSTCFGAYFYVLDTDNYCQVSKNMLLKDEAKKHASHMNCQHHFITGVRHGV